MRRRLWRFALAAALSFFHAHAPADEPTDAIVEVVAFGVEADATVNGPGSGAESPFFAATDAVGLPEELALQVGELFAETIDFHRDLDRGYVCTLVYEMTYPNGMPKAGHILAARIETPERRLDAYRYPTGAGTPSYYDDRGLDIHRTPRLIDPSREPRAETQAVTSAFRRSPLEFSRVTSLPAVLRLHPILKTWRAHRGTDYGAAIGTRVRATAEGVVGFVGERGGYGKLIELRHFDRYTSRYGHLNAYAPGLAVGATVSKGQVIGQVGMTGLATGPHLHYELDADPGAGRPEQLVFAVWTVPPEMKNEFQSRVAEYRRKFAYANRANMVRLE